MTTLSGNWDSNSHRFLEIAFAQDRTKQRATKYFALKRAVAMNTFYALAAFFQEVADFFEEDGLVGLRWGFRLLLLFEFLEKLYDDEDAERDDDKIDDGLDERAVLDFGIPDFRAQLGEIDFFEGYADERHHS